MPSLKKIFPVTFFLDMMSFLVVNSIFGYKLFEFLLFHMGLMKDAWIKNPNENEFYEYSPALYKIWLIFFGALLLILTPFLFKKDLESLKSLNQLFVITLFFLALVILIESPFFRNHYTNHNDSDLPYEFKLIKPIDLNFLPIVFSFIGCYYS